MYDGIKDKVAILGMGCTRFGELWEKDANDLMVEAFKECLTDAGIEKRDLQAAFLGTNVEEIHVGKSGIPLAKALKLPFLPVTRVDNWCATGTEALRMACYAVAAGVCDFALALGVEKLKDTGYGGLPGYGLSVQELAESAQMSDPGRFAQVATAYSSKWKIPMDNIKNAMAHISVKSHRNGALNPRAHLRKIITEEQVKAAPYITYPLGLFDCCGVSDGAAAAIVTTPEIAKKLKPNQDVLKVKALQIAVSSGEEALYKDWDGAHFATTRHAAQKAYQEAGITSPREELNMLEVHDCFSITEFVTMEDLQISKYGGAYDDVMNGFFDLDGKMPCQADGGLKCFGHPIGASGLRMLFAIYEQIFKEIPEERKLKNMRIGLTHNLGGQPSENVCSIVIAGRD